MQLKMKVRLPTSLPSGAALLCWQNGNLHLQPPYFYKCIVNLISGIAQPLYNASLSKNPDPMEDILSNKEITGENTLNRKSQEIENAFCTWDLINWSFRLSTAVIRWLQQPIITADAIFISLDYPVVQSASQGQHQYVVKVVAKGHVLYYS